MGQPETWAYVVYLDDTGQVIDAHDRDGRDLIYDEEEKGLKKDIIGAHLYTHNGCCWRKVAGVWKCRDRYCSS